MTLIKLILCHHHFTFQSRWPQLRRFRSWPPQNLIILTEVKRKWHPATGTGEDLILCDGLTLVVLHNGDLRQCSAASQPLSVPTPQPPFSVIVLLAWLHDQTSCWHLPRCSSDQLKPSAETVSRRENQREHTELDQEPYYWFHHHHWCAAAKL